MATIKAKRKTFNPKTPCTCIREFNSAQKAVRIAEKKIKAARRLVKKHMAMKKAAAKKLTAKKKALQKAKSCILKAKNLAAKKAAAKKKLIAKKQTSTKRKVAKNPTTTKRKAAKKRTSTKKPVSTGKRTTAERRKVAKRTVQCSQRGQEYQAREAFSEQRADREEDLSQVVDFQEEGALEGESARSPSQSARSLVGGRQKYDYGQQEDEPLGRMGSA